jgi:hypothetical protein
MIMPATVLALDNLIQCGHTSKKGDDNIRPLGNFLRRSGCFAAILDEFIDLLLDNIIADNWKSFLQKVCRYGRSHDAQSDYSHLHIHFVG